MPVEIIPKEPDADNADVGRLTSHEGLHCNLHPLHKITTYARFFIFYRGTAGGRGR